MIERSHPIMRFLLFLLGPILPLLLRRQSRRYSPATAGRIELRGLNSNVTVLRDRWGVPHIRARDMHDLMFAQGFVHAQDRLWQMDFVRRVVAGGLSEIFGRATVDVDRWMRILGLRRFAALHAAGLGPPMLSELQAYAEGVNAFVSGGRLPFEFSLLKYHPEPWTPEDTLSWNKMMSWSLSVNWESELIRQALIEKLGEELERELEPVLLERWQSVLPEEIQPSPLKNNSVSRRFTGPGAAGGAGSNCWVVSGSRTRSGAPLLASDMHLVLSLPAIWYENHLTCDGYDVTGITAPGVPNIIAGHNGRVAWGFTAGFSDVQDLYIERVRFEKEGTVRYEHMGRWLEASVINETIKVRGGKPVHVQVVMTGHGPLINDLAPGLASESPLALRWVAYEQDTTSRGVYEMLRAQSCSELHEALRHWTSPNVNVLYADIHGNIGSTLAGLVPVRHGMAADHERPTGAAAGARRREGLIPVPGWTGEHEWKGFIPFDELPHRFNPRDGYIVSANNRITGDDCPYFLGSDYCTEDRAERIREMLTAAGTIDRACIQRMQVDQLSTAARRIGRNVEKIRSGIASLPPETSLMSGWDGSLGPGRPAAAFYQVFVRRLLSLLLAEELGPLAEHYMGKGVNPVIAAHSMIGWRSLEWLQELLESDGPEWNVLGRREKKNELIAGALLDTARFLKKRLGSDPRSWSWEKLHRLTFAHPLGTLRPLGRFFNRGPFPLGGDGTTVWAGFSNMHDLAPGTMIGPPCRCIVDLGDPDASLSVLAPGQSGAPSSGHYDDQIEPWLRGGYHPMTYSPDLLDTVEGSRLELTPA
jgi:penicillin amidase